MIMSQTGQQTIKLANHVKRHESVKFSTVFLHLVKLVEEIVQRVNNVALM